MNFDMDSFINHAKETLSNSVAGFGHEPGTELKIHLRPHLELRHGTEHHLVDILTGFPEDPSTLEIKMFGNCMYFNFNKNKSVIIGDRPQDVHFRIGENGIPHLVVIPAAHS